MSAKSGILILARFSRYGLGEVFSQDDTIFDWDKYYESALEKTVGTELARRVVHRVASDGLDYAILDDDERTALDIVLVSLFSPEHEEALAPIIGSELIDHVPLPTMHRLLARAEEQGSEGLLRAVVEGRRLEIDEPPDGWAYAMFDTKETEALAAHIRSLLAAGGISRAHARDIEKKLLPVLDEIVEEEEWFMVDGMPTECPRRALKAATMIPPASLRAADYQILVERSPGRALEILEALLPKTSGPEAKKVLDRLVTVARLLGRTEEQASWERRRAELLAGAR